MLEDGRARLEVELEADRVDHDLRHTLGHLVDSAKIPGFRKGKVPPAVVLQRMGREEVFEETMREFLPAWVGEAIAESRLRPADRPSVDFKEIPGEGEPFTFTAEFPLQPTGTLPETLEIEGVQEQIDVPADEVDAELERLREESSPIVTVDALRRPATSSRSTCTSARAASPCPRLRRSGTSCSSATGARSRRSSARCAA